MTISRSFKAVSCSILILGALQTIPASAQQGETIGNDSIRRQQSSDKAKSYPRQGQYGRDADSPIQKGQQESLQPQTPSPPIRHDRQRDLVDWKQDIANYSGQHYGESRWQLEPTCIVLHYTAGTSFPWNLVNSQSFAGERPGLASHYVIDGNNIWQILPTNVRSRGAYGINHRAINIEMVAADANDLSYRTETLESCARLVAYLSGQYGIPLSKIYSHQQVGSMNRQTVPEALDLIDSRPYSKIDPGENNMKTVKRRVLQLQR